MTETTMTRPEQSSKADVTLVVAAPGGGTAWKTAVKPGDPVELFWVGGYEELTLPAKIRQVEEGEEPL